MGGVVWTPVAESDLDEILFFISLVDRRPATGKEFTTRFGTLLPNMPPKNCLASDIRMRPKAGSI